MHHPDTRHSPTYPLTQLLSHHAADLNSKSVALNSLLKMSVRAGGDPAVLSAIRTAIEPLSKSLSVELQQRATEYLLLLSSQWDGLRPELLARMPVLDEATLRSRRAFTTPSSSGGDMLLDSPSKGGGGNDLMNLLGTPPAGGGGGGNVSAPASAGTAGSSLLDLDDIFGSPAPPAMGSGAMGSGAMPPAAIAPTDMLSDMFGTATTLAPTPASPLPSQPTSMGAMGGGLMGSPAPVLGSSLGPMPPRAAPVVIAYDKNGLTVAIEVTKPEPANPSKTHLLCKFSNSTCDKFSNMSFQAAVPKYLKLEMHPPSSSDVPASSKDSTTQTITLVNSLQGEKNIMLKVKISYSAGGSKVLNYPYMRHLHRKTPHLRT